MKKRKVPKHSIDYSGTVYKGVTILYPIVTESEISSSRRGSYLCRCNFCGKEFPALTDAMKLRKSCGCQGKDHTEIVKARLSKQVGQVYGRLTILRPSEEKVTHLLCRCTCGKEKSISKYFITTGRTLSCGCIRSELQTAKKKPEQYRKLSRYITNNVRRCLKGIKKDSRSELLVGYTKQELIAHIEKQFDENMSWSNYGNYWHIDHIRPIASFLEEGIIDVAIINALINLQPLEKIANLKKGSKYQRAP